MTTTDKDCCRKTTMTDEDDNHDRQDRTEPDRQTDKTDTHRHFVTHRLKSLCNMCHTDQATILYIQNCFTISHLEPLQARVYKSHDFVWCTNHMTCNSSYN